MSVKRATLPEAGKGPIVLVVDDDRRVRELLEIALTAHGFAVITAADGDEAIRRALGQRPDLVVLDVRLPKKSGFEVCDALRGDAEDPSVPIILVSAATETDARLQAFARGADDYLSKPFSPKELIARIKRHLVRSTEARTTRRRAQDLERELARAQEEARRAEAVSRREQALRELAAGAGRDFLTTLDRDALADRILASIQRRLDVGVAAMLAADVPGGELAMCAVRGSEFERLSRFTLSPNGDLGRFLAGLDRPVLSADLERIPELRRELEPFMAAGFSLFVPLRGARGLNAVIVTEERHDGQNPSRGDLDVLSGLCESAAVAVENGIRFRVQLEGLLDLLTERAHAASGHGAIFQEAAWVVARAARVARIAPRDADRVRRAVALGDWAAGADGSGALERLAAIDPTGRVCELKKSIDAYANARALDEHSSRAQALLVLGRHYAEARSRALAAEHAFAVALERAGHGLDPVTRTAFELALDERTRSAAD